MTPPPEPTEILLNLKISGASNNTTEEEIEEFLFGIKVDKLVKEIAPNGRSTGNFYAKCIAEEDVLEALRYNNRKIGNRLISVESVQDYIFEMNEKNADIMSVDGVIVEGDYKDCMRYFIDGSVYSLIT
eukprot:CAMPEP_0168314588 /NCGR_PEP_ID=MMETSP0210-20121227/9048_1 /TAXON_ID=40633 /ORGANISM="Condylostoma magnum, Strain COL2" /LENGTH=128 /DNA_ID=CAMNT_0008284209 /DNA_START=505 /DNA_END=891 /DNA_ORIENTATION=+